jgi:hypothetical protein
MWVTASQSTVLSIITGGGKCRSSESSTPQQTICIISQIGDELNATDERKHRQELAASQPDLVCAQLSGVRQTFGANEGSSEVTSVCCTQLTATVGHGERLPTNDVNSSRCPYAPCF